MGMAGALGAAAGGTALSAYSQYAAGQAQKVAAYQNAAEMRRSADQEMTAGEQQASYAITKSERTTGTNIASVGASGADVGGGSPLLAIVDQVHADEVTAANVRRTAINRALTLRNQSAMTEASGDAAATGASFGAFATILGGAGAIGLKMAGMGGGPTVASTPVVNDSPG